MSQERRSIGTSNRGRPRSSASVPKAVIYDFGASVRLWRELYAGAAVSIFETTGDGTLTARVPHPLQFNKPRTTTGDIADATRTEIGTHIMFGWMIPAAGGVDFSAVSQDRRSSRPNSSSSRASPCRSTRRFSRSTSWRFPAHETETLRENVAGYNAGVDMTWRFADHSVSGCCSATRTERKHSRRQACSRLR